MCSESLDESHGRDSCRRGREKEKEKEREKEKEKRRGDKGSTRGRGVALNSLAGVRGLISEASELRIRCPELTALRGMARRAGRWRMEAREALREEREVSESELDRLLSELSSLPLRLGERALLHTRLRKKRWLLCRRAALGMALAGLPSLPSLREAVTEAVELGLGEVEEVRAASARVTDAEEWIEQVSPRDCMVWPR